MDIVDALHRLSVVAGRPEVRPLDVEVGAGQVPPAHGAGRRDVRGRACRRVGWIRIMECGMLLYEGYKRREMRVYL